MSISDIFALTCFFNVFIAALYYNGEAMRAIFLIVKTRLKK